MGTHTTFEVLETRRLMAVSMTITQGFLVITGTSRSEHLVIRGANTAVSPGHPHRLVIADDHDNIVATYNVGDFTALEVNLGGGDDVLTIFDTPGHSKDVPDGLNRPGYTGFANSFIFMGSGHDYVDLRCSGESIFVHGGRGNDTLLGGRGQDHLIGDSGNDTLDGRWGGDALRGEDGDDTFLNGTRAEGGDIVTGGAGFDTMDYSERTAPVAFGGLYDYTENSAHRPHPINGRLLIDGRTKDSERAYNNAFPSAGTPKPYAAYRLPDTAKLDGAGGLEKDFIQADIEAVIGGSGNDVIAGNLLDNVLDGRGGNDFIVGGIGDDALYGGDGDDTLLSADTRDGMPGFPGRGSDRVVGGNGHDVARTDGRDTLVRIEIEDELAFLTS
jgi:Ca2+-binding RTX toxin-like protein